MININTDYDNEIIMISEKNVVLHVRQSVASLSSPLLMCSPATSDSSHTSLRMVRTCLHSEEVQLFFVLFLVED